MLTRRQCYFLFCSGLATAFLSRPGYADHNVDVTATVINNTCRLEVNDNGVVRLPTVKLDYFSNEITAETDYAGGQNFTLRLVDCPVSDDKISQVLFTFSPQQGALPADNLQVFANELAQNNDGAKNVGVVIFPLRATLHVLMCWMSMGCQKLSIACRIAITVIHSGHSTPGCKKLSAWKMCHQGW